MKKISADVYVLEGPRALNIKKEEIIYNELADDEVVAKTIVSVVSPGTEYAAYNNAPPLRPMQVYPRLVGYCNVAEVIAVGEGVTNIEIGNLITTLQSHRSAFKIKRSEIISKLQKGDDPVTHATTYLWHLGYYPLIRTGTMAGSNVAVIGLGVLGLTAIAAANIAGCQVLGFSNRDVAIPDAIEFGAKAASKLDHELGENDFIREHFGDTGVDLVIITSNDWNDWLRALDMARDGGAIAILGFPGRGGEIAAFNPLDSRFLYDKDLTIYSCGTPPSLSTKARFKRFTLSRNYDYLSNLLRQKRLPDASLISDHLSWMELEKFYKKIDERDHKTRTAALYWR
jgi:threonine dehydrogenase-like Zn-dependent dehydrogenase